MPRPRANWVAPIAERGFRMVFGGGNVGLMGETARAARDAGAAVIGILPHSCGTWSRR